MPKTAENTVGVTHTPPLVENANDLLTGFLSDVSSSITPKFPEMRLTSQVLLKKTPDGVMGKLASLAFYSFSIDAELMNQKLLLIKYLIQILCEKHRASFVDSELIVFEKGSVITMNVVFALPERRSTYITSETTHDQRVRGFDMYTASTLGQAEKNKLPELIQDIIEETNFLFKDIFGGLWLSTQVNKSRYWGKRKVWQPPQLVVDRLKWLKQLRHYYSSPDESDPVSADQDYKSVVSQYLELRNLARKKLWVIQVTADRQNQQSLLDFVEELTQENLPNSCSDRATVKSWWQIIEREVEDKRGNYFSYQLDLVIIVQIK